MLSRLLLALLDHTCSERVRGTRRNVEQTVQLGKVRQGHPRRRGGARSGRIRNISLGQISERRSTRLLPGGTPRISGAGRQLPNLASAHASAAVLAFARRRRECRARGEREAQRTRGSNPTGWRCLRHRRRFHHDRGLDVALNELQRHPHYGRVIRAHSNRPGQ